MAVGRHYQNRRNPQNSEKLLHSYDPPKWPNPFLFRDQTLLGFTFCGSPVYLPTGMVLHFAVYFSQILGHAWIFSSLEVPLPAFFKKAT